MNRRTFLAATIAAAVPATASPRRIDSTRISAITDEISRSPAEAIQFAHDFGMQWLSLRDMPAPLNQQPKVPYYSMEPAQLKQVMGEFKAAGIKVSFLDTPFLKFDLPGRYEQVNGILRKETNTPSTTISPPKASSAGDGMASRRARDANSTAPSRVGTKLR